MKDEELLALLTEKLQQLEYSLRHNIPKHAAETAVRNLVRTIETRMDETWRN